MKRLLNFPKIQSLLESFNILSGCPLQLYDDMEEPLIFFGQNPHLEEATLYDDVDIIRFSLRKHDKAVRIIIPINFRKKSKIAAGPFYYGDVPVQGDFPVFNSETVQVILSFCLDIVSILENEFSLDLRMSDLIEQPFDISANMVIVCLNDPDKFWPIVNLNKTAQAFFGTQGEEALSLGNYAILEERFKIFSLLTLLKKDDHVSFESELENYRAEKIKVRMNANYINISNMEYVVFLITDANEKSSLDALKNEQLLFMQTLLDEIPTPVFFKDSRDVYRLCNSAFEELMDVKKGEIIGRRKRDLFAGKLAYKGNSQVSIEKGGTAEQLKLKQTDGSEKDIVIYKVKMPGKQKGVVGSIIDITELTKLQQMRDTEQKLAERSLRLASIGTLTAGITHEINQPLTALKSRVEGAIFWGENKDNSSTEELFTALKFAREQAERIEQIIKHMRLLVRNEKNLPEVSAVSINELIQRAVNLLSQQITARNINLYVKLDETIPPLLLNEINFEQVVINLLVNAIEALSEDENIQKIIILKSIRCENGIQIDVEDNGPGIDNDIYSHIFDPFFSTKKERGMGLGLSISENFITAMGGTISAYNMENGGALFTIFFPFPQQKSEEQC